MPDTGLPASRQPRWAPWVTLPLALIGLGLSAYLTYVHFTDPKQLACSDKGHINCLKVTTSNQSEIFGHIPVAVTGLAFYAIVFLLMSPWAWRAVNPWIHRLRLAAMVSGVGMVVYLVIVESVQLHALCLYCTGVHAITVLLFLAVLVAFLFPAYDELPPAPVKNVGKQRQASARR